MGASFAALKDDVFFPAAGAAQAGSRAAYLSAWDSETGGNYLFQLSLRSTALMVEGTRYRIAGGYNTSTDIGITVAVSIADVGVIFATDEVCESILKKILSGNVYFQLHTGNPGTQGTANVLDGIARVRVNESQWSYSNTEPRTT